MPTPERGAAQAWLAALPDPACLVARDLRCRAANPAFAAALGRPARGLAGRTLRELLPAAEAAALLPLAQAALRGRAGTWQGSSGGRQLDCRVTPWRGRQGAAACLLLRRDVTEAAAREADLLRRNAYLQAVLDGIADGVAIDKDGVLVMCNAGFRRIFDAPESLARPGMLSDDFVRFRQARGMLYPHEREGGEAAAMAARQRARILEAGGALVERFRINGRWLEVHRRHVPPDGGFVGTYTDITAQVEAEEARREKQQALEQAQQMGAIASMLAGVAHELNNPLAIVAAQATLLSVDAAGTPFAAQAEKVSQAARRCGGIVNSLLARARGRSPRREKVDLRALVAGAMDLARPRLDAAEVLVTTDLPQRLPRPVADPDQLLHLLSNLLGNAVTALRERPAPRTITLSLRRRGETVLLAVADNGPGIPEALRSQVFSPFFTTRPQGGGTGIGLALCRTIVQDHGGTIEVRETPGGGATLLVTLPLVPG